MFCDVLVFSMGTFCWDFLGFLTIYWRFPDFSWIF